jgi:Flp pilus assembly protein TadB
MNKIANRSQTENHQSESDATRSRSKRSVSNQRDITALLDDMLHEDKYDQRIRPNIGGKSKVTLKVILSCCPVFMTFLIFVSLGEPIKVEVGIWVIALDSINVIDMV